MNHLQFSGSLSLQYLAHAIDSVRNIHFHPHSIWDAYRYFKRLVLQEAFSVSPASHTSSRGQISPLCSLPQCPVPTSRSIYPTGHKCLSVSALDCEHHGGKDSDALYPISPVHNRHPINEWET